MVDTQEGGISFCAPVDLEKLKSKENNTCSRCGLFLFLGRRHFRWTTIVAAGACTYVDGRHFVEGVHKQKAYT